MRTKALRSGLLLISVATATNLSAQISIRNLVIQSYILQGANHARVHNSDTFSVRDTVDGHEISFNYLYHNRELIGDYVECKLGGSKLVQATVAGYYSSYNLFRQNLLSHCNGQYRSWYNNGQRSSQAMYADGQLNGMKKVWDVNGTLVSEEFFKNGHQDSINLYYHQNSCKVKAFLKCKADYSTDTLEFKEISRNGLLTNWFVKDSIIYHWNPVQGYYIELFDSAKAGSDRRWFTKNGVLRKHESYGSNGANNTFEIQEYSELGILQSHAIYTYDSIGTVLEKRTYNEKGVFITSSTETLVPEEEDLMEEEPEETYEIFEYWHVTSLASPAGGLYALEESLNRMPKYVKIRKRSIGVYFVDVTVGTSGKIKDVSWVNGSSALTDVTLKHHIYQSLLKSTWKPYVNRDDAVESVYRLTLSIKDPI